MADLKRGDKRQMAKEIMEKFMTNYPEGHAFEECTKEIRETIWGVTDDPIEQAKREGQARSYYVYITKNKLIDGFVPGKKSGRKPRTKKEKTETEVSEKRGTPERLALMKKIASHRKNKLPTPEEATKEIEALAAAGAQYQYAETEETSESLELA